MPNITHGPVLGAVTDTEIKVWAASDISDYMTVEYVEYGNPFPGTDVTATVKLAYNVNQIKLTGLTPGTRYSYRVKTSTSDIEGPYDFWTMPEEGGEYHTYICSDSHFSPAMFDPAISPSFGYGLSFMNNFRAMLEGRDSSMAAVLIVYGDLFISDADNYSKFFSEQMDMRVNPYAVTYTNWFMELLKYVPYYTTWDDHDGLMNNWCKFTETPGIVNRDIAKDMFTLMNPMPDLDEDNGGGIAHSMRLGNILYLMLDERFDKEPNPGILAPYSILWPDYAPAATLGANQMAWLRGVLHNNLDADLLVIISAQTFVDNTGAMGGGAGARRDSIGAYSKAERTELIQYILQSTSFKDLIIFTGDDHRVTIRTRNWLHSKQVDINDLSYDYTTVPTWQLGESILYDFKATVGAQGGTLGSNAFNDPGGNLYDDLDHHAYYQIKVESQRTITQFHVDLVQRVVEWDDVLAETDYSTRVPWHKTFFERVDKGEPARVQSIYETPFAIIDADFEDDTPLLPVQGWDDKSRAIARDDLGALLTVDDISCLLSSQCQNVTGTPTSSTAYVAKQFEVIFQIKLFWTIRFATLGVDPEIAQFSLFLIYPDLTGETLINMSGKAIFELQNIVGEKIIDGSHGFGTHWFQAIVPAPNCSAWFGTPYDKVHNTVIDEFKVTYEPYTPYTEWS